MQNLHHDLDHQFSRAYALISLGMRGISPVRLPGQRSQQTDATFRRLALVAIAFVICTFGATPLQAQLAPVVSKLASDVKTDSESKPAQDLKIQFNVNYGDQSEEMHRADIYRPKSDEKLPAIILIHGGAWMLGDKNHDAQHARTIASNGFVVMAINYRLAPKHRYPAQVDDCFMALEWLEKNKDQLNADTGRVGTWGYSAGGHLAAMMATKPKSGLPRVRACVAGGAPCDLTAIPDDNRLLKGFLGGTKAQLPDVYRDASPVTHVSNDDPPVFLFHGTSDWLVPPLSSEKMYDTLVRENVPCERFLVEKKSHIMTFLDRNALQESIVFLKRILVSDN